MLPALTFCSPSPSFVFSSIVFFVFVRQSLCSFYPQYISSILCLIYALSIRIKTVLDISDSYCILVFVCLLSQCVCSRFANIRFLYSFVFEYINQSISLFFLIDFEFLYLCLFVCLCVCFYIYDGNICGCKLWIKTLQQFPSNKAKARIEASQKSVFGSIQHWIIAAFMILKRHFKSKSNSTPNPIPTFVYDMRSRCIQAKAFSCQDITDVFLRVLPALLFGLLPSPSQLVRCP